MRNSVWIKSVLTAAAVTLGAAAATARAAEGDWPRYLGPNGTNISSEKIADKWPEQGPKKLWSVKVGRGYSSTVAVDGKVYAFGQDGGNEVLSCLDADTGKVVWRESYKGGYPNNDYPGARATPTIDGDKVYTLGGGGILAARDAKTGKGIWSYDTLKSTGGGLLQWGQASSPLIHGNLVIVQAGDGGSVAVAVDKATGKEAWQSQAKGKAGYAQVVAIDVGGKPQLIVFAGGGPVAMDPVTGKTIWQQAWKTSYDVNAANPLYDGKGNLFVASGYNVGGGMFQVTATGAKKVWGPNRAFQCKFQPPILDGNAVYLVSEDKRGTIKSMSWPDGKVNWDLDDPKVGFGGSLVKVGDKLIAQAQTGELHLIKATPTAGELVSTFKPFDGSDKVWSMPVVYKGKLYAKGPDELACFDVK